MFNRNKLIPQKYATNLAYISIEHYITVNSPSSNFDFKKANWGFFQELLRSSRLNINSLTNIDKLNELISLKIMNAAQKSIPFQSQKFFKSSLPKNIKCSRQIPMLIKDGKWFNTDKDKGEIFGNILKTTFSPHLDLDMSERDTEIADTISDFLKNQKCQEQTNSQYSLLFADDLATFFIFKKKKLKNGYSNGK
ncbi:hypothetical protein BpHYR1_017584 [Brachionus plicatilis]|uniref:RNA-directed DNA polymerase from mobile element jockey-like n=1 Tax=Brachionus plicatilis TaxID=10195 RepID=A0A3M7RP76_BRAPC|nr:hypothetical protein BpHYR1_017584 [Brachionus plicatilis]